MAYPCIHYKLREHFLFPGFRCLLFGIPFYITAVTPVAGIILLITIVLCISMKTKHGLKRSKHTTRFYNITADLRIAFNGSILLGITWVFGLIAVDRASIASEWTFSGSNGSKTTLI